MTASPQPGAGPRPWTLGLPRDPSEIDAIHRARKRIAVERARRYAAAARRGVGERIKATFGLTPEVEVLATGTLARDFEKAVKAPRFVDRRG
jgi:hypothetical protein